MAGYGLQALGDALYGKSKPKRQPVNKSQKDAVLLKQNFKCAICKKPLGIRVHYDHIKEVSKGGKSTTCNLRAIHPDCHHERHVLERAKETDKKRKNEGKYTIDPITGMKRKVNNSSYIIDPWTGKKKKVSSGGIW